MRGVPLMQCSDNVPMDKTGWARWLCVLPVAVRRGVPSGVPRRAVRMDYRSISVASIKIIKAPPFLFRIAGSRSSPRTQFAASTTTHISGTRHGSRELENISTHETSPHLCLLRAEPEQDRRRGASVTLSLYRAHSWPYHTARMAVSHNAPLHTGWTPQLSGSLPRAH